MKKREVAAVETVVTGLQTVVKLCHPLNGKTYSALLDTGCSASIVATELVSWYNPPKNESAVYKTASGDTVHISSSI